MTVLWELDCRREPPLDEAHGFLSPAPTYVSLQRLPPRAGFVVGVRIVADDEHASYTLSCARLLTKACAGVLRDDHGAVVDDESNAAPLTREQLEDAWRAELVDVEAERERIQAEREREWRREHGEVARKLAANDWSDV